MRRVVVTGIGAVTPLGTGVPAFFDGLRQARSAIGMITRFDASSFETHLAAEVTDLDHSKVPLPELEAPALHRDPKSLYGLVAAREAVQQSFGDQRPIAHYAPRRLGAFIAAGLEICRLEDLAPHLAGSAVNGGSLLEMVEQSAPGSRYLIPADLGARCILRETGVRGPFYVNLSACAAGTQALGEAFLAIRDGAIDAAIAGGYDSMINPLGFGGFCMLGALSKSNELGPAASRPFDANRDGFVLGEGAGMCILEALESARRRGARPLAEVFGYCSSLDAFRVSDPHPDQTGAIRAIRGALASAGFAPAEIDYINAHGTGTLKNDPAETASIKAVFPQGRRPPVSSTKSQIGHLIGAAGAVEFLAGIFAVRNHLLPATINLVTPDPECDLDYVVGEVRPAEVRTFMSNSFGFGGQNAVIVAGEVR